MTSSSRRSRSLAAVRNHRRGQRARLQPGGRPHGHEHCRQCQHAARDHAGVSERDGGGSTPFTYLSGQAQVPLAGSAPVSGNTYTVNLQLMNGSTAVGGPQSVTFTAY